MFWRWDSALIVYFSAAWISEFLPCGKVQRKLRKDVREGTEGNVEEGGEEKEEKEAKPPKRKPKAKAKGKAKSKLEAKGNERSEEHGLLSEAEELEHEEYVIKNQLRQEDYEDAEEKVTAAGKKHTKGKKKKQAKVTHDDAGDEEHEKEVCEKADPPKGVKRRLDIDDEEASNYKTR